MYNKLINIQSKLKAPKGQRNNFGGYAYRSMEDILEAVKPLMEEQKCYLVVGDSIELVGDRYYIKATATLFNDDGKEIASNTAYAREPQNKKGMDEAQLTGATSSYARKYALNGLFAIDDTKDADTNEQQQQVNNAPTPMGNYLSSKQVLEIEELIARTNSDKFKFLETFNIGKIDELTQAKYEKAVKILNKKLGVTK